MDDTKRDDAAVKVAEALWPQRYMGDLTRAEWQQCYAVVDAANAQLREAVSLAGEAADMLDELTVYWEVDGLPPEVASRFGEVRDALHHLGGSHE